VGSQRSTKPCDADANALFEANAFLDAKASVLLCEPTSVYLCGKPHAAGMKMKPSQSTPVDKTLPKTLLFRRFSCLKMLDLPTLKKGCQPA